jgi:hypothetical protein
VILPAIPSLTNAWAVFVLFAIPIGGGIPAGVVLAQSKGIDWRIMLVLYFLSDVALAIVFEAIMIWFVAKAKTNPKLGQVHFKMKESTAKMVAKYGVNPGPFTLVLIAFGVDPMTGRAATAASGPGFFSGWAIAILGDMFFFSLIMVSTIWLNNLLGDGTWTAIIIMVLMMGVPALIRKLRKPTVEA